MMVVERECLDLEDEDLLLEEFKSPLPVLIELPQVKRGDENVKDLLWE